MVQRWKRGEGEGEGGLYSPQSPHDLVLGVEHVATSSLVIFFTNSFIKIAPDKTITCETCEQDGLIFSTELMM